MLREARASSNYLCPKADKHKISGGEMPATPPELPQWRESQLLGISILRLLRIKRSLSHRKEQPPEGASSHGEQEQRR